MSFSCFPFDKFPGSHFYVHCTAIHYVTACDMLRSKMKDTREGKVSSNVADVRAAILAVLIEAIERGPLRMGRALHGTVILIKWW